MDKNQKQLFSPRKILYSKENMNNKLSKKSPLSHEIEDLEDLVCDMEILAILTDKDDYLKKNFKYDGNENVTDVDLYYKTIYDDLQ